MRRDLNEEDTLAYTKGTDSLTMACPLCLTAAVMGISHMQTPFSPPDPANKQDGIRTVIFHQGPLLIHNGFRGLALSEFCGVGFCTGRCSLFFHTDTHTHRSAMMAEEKIYFLTKLHPTASFPLTFT